MNNKEEKRLMRIKNSIDALKKQRDLLEQISNIKNELEVFQKLCDHINVGLGWDGRYLCRDTSICKCLFCGKENPQSKYPLIKAFNYKDELYSHGEELSYRTSRMIDLQELAVKIMERKENISNEQLSIVLNEIAQNPIAAKHENLAIVCAINNATQLEKLHESTSKKKVKRRVK